MDGMSFMQMMSAAMANAGIGSDIDGSDFSRCAEGNWSSHPTGALFRSTKELDCEALSVYLTKRTSMDQIDDWE